MSSCQNISRSLKKYPLYDIVNFLLFLYFFFIFSFLFFSELYFVNLFLAMSDIDVRSKNISHTIHICRLATYGH